MFSEFPKLFDRNFVIGFLMPAVIFISAILFLFDIFLSIDLITLFKENPILGSALFAFLSWLLGIILLITNRDILRLFEGYGKFNPARLIKFIEKRRFSQITARINEIEKMNVENHEKSFGSQLAINNELDHLMEEFSTRFPDKEEFLLPTSFGNTIRSFEVYSRVMYGLESIDGWSRLVSVIPRDYLEKVNNAKAQVDFWVNLGLVSFFLLLIYLYLLIYISATIFIWFPVLTIILIWLSSYRARRSSVVWGDFVKASFDIFLPDLCRKLRITLPLAKEDERKLWESFSLAIIYRLPNELPIRNYEPTEETKTSNK